jgi:hypothetical protein
MVGAAEKLKPFCGTIKRVIVRYDRVLLVFYRTAVHLVILSIEPSAEEALLDQIGDSIGKLTPAWSQRQRVTNLMKLKYKA